MEKWNVARKILVFGLFYVGGSCDWVEIPQAQEKLAVHKSLSTTKNYAFPRNEYVYTKPPKTNERVQHSTYPPTTKAPTKVEAITESTSLEIIKSPSEYNDEAPTIQKRIDDSEEIHSEKIVRNTEKPEEEEEEEEEETEAKKGTESFLPFLKKVQDELILKGHKNLKGKISMLKSLRDDLLLNIDERIGQMWGGTTRQPSEARGYKEDDHEMHFPSNEGALLTIGFLTFAVFLIKLVLRLVQALKDKHNMVVVTPTVTTNAAVIGRKRRDVMLDDQKRILQLIDDYRFT